MLGGSSPTGGWLLRAVVSLEGQVQFWRVRVLSLTFKEEPRVSLPLRVYRENEAFPWLSSSFPLSS